MTSQRMAAALGSPGADSPCSMLISLFLSSCQISGKKQWSLCRAQARFPRVADVATRFLMMIIRWSRCLLAPGVYNRMGQKEKTFLKKKNGEFTKSRHLWGTQTCSFEWMCQSSFSPAERESSCFQFAVAPMKLVKFNFQGVVKKYMRYCVCSLKAFKFIPVVWLLFTEYGGENLVFAQPVSEHRRYSLPCR